MDKFELINADIFDEKFELPEKVDCVVLSYTLTTFINSYEQLSQILKGCFKQTKPDGYMLVADFAYVEIPKDDFFYGMYTTQKEEGKRPGDFEPFNFLIDKAPDHNFEIFNIESHLMFRAGLEAGFNSIEMRLQYPDPSVKNDPVIRKYLDTCNPQDYILKYRTIKY